jgi:phage terminase large subunit GpA-like protein
MTEAARAIDQFYEDLWHACRQGFALDPLLEVDEWADQYRWLSGKAASEPGKWRTTRTPYLRKIMKALSSMSTFERVVFAKGSQIGATELGLCWLGYIIREVPGPAMVVCPTVELAKRFSKQRLDPMIEDTPCLRGLVKDHRSRDSGNTIMLKEFPQGLVVLTGANSGVGMRSMPARYLDLEEIDGYPASADDEGDPVVLAQRALRTFGRRKKIYMNSTPLMAGTSRIERELEACDQKWIYHVPCPECQALQPLEWAQVTWPEGETAKAQYQCRACETLIPEHRKTWMLANGEWVAEWQKGEKSIGFHLSALYSPVGWFSWADAAAMYEKAKADGDLMRIFWNTVLGLGFQETTEAPDWKRLAARRETYRIGEVPEGDPVHTDCRPVFLTGAADVQKGRIEYEVKAWNRRKESWSIDYGVLEGDIAGADVWRELDAVLAKDWPCAGGGTLPIRVFCVDSGYESERVYEWARRHPQPTWVKQTGVANCRQPRTVAVVKGVERGMSIVWSSTRADLGGRRGLRIYSVSNFQTKAELYGWLRLDPPTAEEAAAGAKHPPGYCHVPQYSDEYFKQLTSETVVTTMVKGFPKRTFQLQKGLRNEVLDAAAYNRAAAELFGLTRFQDRHWRELAQARGIVRPTGPLPPPDPPPATGGPPRPPGPQPRRAARPVRYRMG